MASILALRPHSPLKRSFSDTPYFPPCSPLKDTSFAPLRDITSRNVSACSLYTPSSNRASEWLHGSENAPPSLTSLSLLDLAPERGRQESHPQPTDHGPRKRSCGTNRPPPSFSYAAGPSIPFVKGDDEPIIVRDVNENSDNLSDAMELDNGNVEDSELFQLYEAIHIPLPEEPRRLDDASGVPNEASVEPLVVCPQPFRRWISTLRRRHVQRRKEHDVRSSRLSLDTIDKDISMVTPLPSLSEAPCKTTESVSSSLIYVTAMKSASITIASASMALRTDGGAHGNFRLGNRSSNYSDARRSMDSHGGPRGPVIDESAWMRSIQRRKVVEELISSEESYIADLKVLINDYFMILSAIPTLPHQIRASIQQNISQILQLHEDLLSELHQTVPLADFTKSAQQENYPVTRAKHIRFHSADLMPGRLVEHKATRRLRHSLDIGRSPERRPVGLASDTKTIGQIARIFNKHMKRFFAYEEYGAHWTTMSQDLTLACKGLHGWHEYERGIEALSKVVASENNKENSSRKALSFSDLLIKPIQRVCKYPLLFDDLCRHTPVYDDPEAHAELEKALFRLQETIREVNKAKDDPKTRRLIEITWQLQDRLTFQEQAISRALVFRLLGHVLVCGTLHVTYQTPERIKGQYMVCVLYKSCLVLATTGRFYTSYNVVASMPLANASVEEPDNGRGLQCHTAPHTWKLVFEHGHRLHEIILSACSSQEEEVWKTQLRERIVSETHDFVEGQSTMQDMFSSLSLDIKSIGPVFGHADSLVRRMSVHRAATLGSKTNMIQVIIKNTQAQKLPEPPLPTCAPNSVTRSQSHMSINHVPTLAPRRAERTRLETALEDVWTKDILPFPGMSNRRVETQIRASANSVMRKLSMASIASNFSRRSPSFSSMSNTRSEDSYGSRAHKISQGNMRAHPSTDRRPAPAIVDFHNAPAAFLPTDFELQDTRPDSRRRRLANRAAGAERSSEKEKAVPGKPKRARRLSTHIINLPRTDPSNGVEARFPSHGSDSTVLRPAEANIPTRKRGGNEKQKAKEGKEEGSRVTSSSGPPSTKKFLKSKSRIFRFWV